MSCEQVSYLTSDKKKEWMAINCNTVKSSFIQSGNLVLPNSVDDDGDYLVKSTGNVLTLVNPPSRAFYSGYYVPQVGGYSGQVNLLPSRDITASGFSYQINGGVRCDVSTPHIYNVTYTSFGNNPPNGLDNETFITLTCTNPNFRNALTIVSANSTVSPITSFGICLIATGLIGPNDEIIVQAFPQIGQGFQLSGTNERGSSLVITRAD